MALEYMEEEIPRDTELETLLVEFKSKFDTFRAMATSLLVMLLLIVSIQLLIVFWAFFRWIL